MSKFFRSQIIQEEMQEIFETQKDLYAVIMRFPTMTVEEQRDHMKKLISLIDKQEVMWTRLSLSDDPEAKEMKDNCLLYTSPSPRDGRISRMPSSA